jgi:hypothetical protein
MTKFLAFLFGTVLLTALAVASQAGIIKPERTNREPFSATEAVAKPLPATPEYGPLHESAATKPAAEPVQPAAPSPKTKTRRTPQQSPSSVRVNAVSESAPAGVSEPGTEQAPKATFKSRLRKLGDRLMALVPQGEGGATAGVILGIIGLVFVLIAPPVGLVLNIIGLIFSIINRKEKFATLGLILNVIGLVLNIIFPLIIIPLLEKPVH